MAAYPYMIQIAHNVIETVISEWQNQPYRWLKERDLQAEIGGRLSQIFQLQGKGELRGHYKWAAKGLDSQQVWSRVSFEPYLAYQYKGKRHWCYPDIVIWKDVPSNSSPNDDTTTGWPALWACELKYGSTNSGSWDYEKLKHLLDQGRTDYACTINVHFERHAIGDGVDWSQDPKLGRRLWLCEVKLPRKRSRT